MTPRLRPHGRGPGGSNSSGDGGYALVAAVAAMAAFAYVAFGVMAATRGGDALVAGRLEQARLAADADGGIEMALHGLASDDQTARWPADGSVRTETFDGARLSIVIDDERTKAPLNAMNDAQARGLFVGAGVAGRRLDALVAEFRDWQSPLDPTQPAPRTSPGRHGPFATVGELAGLQDMDQALFERVAPALTVFFEDTSPFDPNRAMPLAAAAMTARDQMTADTPPTQEELIVREFTKSRALKIEDNPLGHTLTIRVVAEGRNGARAERMAIVELTGDEGRPYWVRYAE